MVGKVNEIDDSQGKVFSCIDEKKSFILEAGAGSGKTWLLIQSLKHILDNFSNSLIKCDQQIVCITYTNVAKDEIFERIDNNALVLVSTIHEFLWDIIKNYQSELKTLLIEHNDSLEPVKKIQDLEEKLRGNKIEYSKYGKSLEDGQISHDDVITFSELIFKKYPKISKIIADKYPYIFIDEYQDTAKSTVYLLVDELLRRNEYKMVVGFFGDSMQKIYDQGVGEIKSKELEFITKKDNYRCSVKVINLLNKIRPTLLQSPSGKNVEGKTTLFYCNDSLSSSDNYTKLLNHLTLVEGWDFDPRKTKVLMLTHKGIADKLNYKNLLKTYDTNMAFGREKLIKKEERFSDLIFNLIEKLVFFYENKNYGDFIELLEKKGFSLESYSQKSKINENMTKLNKLRNKGKIKDVLSFIFKSRLIKKSQKIKDFESKISGDNLDEHNRKNKFFYDELLDIDYKEVMNLYKYMEEQTPFSTKHGVKGSEYENVLVVIDDNSWNQYNFNNVFKNDLSNLNRHKRTLNLLYVCCSRAKNKLAILCLSKIDSEALLNITGMFEAQNVKKISSL